MADKKPTVAVLGGCGFIGRELVRLLVAEDVAQSITVVDKVPPQMAWLGPSHLPAFKSDVVNFKSANLINPASVASVFETSYDWVVNVAGETKLGLNETVYEEGITKLSTNCVNAAAKQKVGLYLEVSDGAMSNSDKVGQKEGDACKPWHVIAQCKEKVERHIREAADLNWVVVRPGMVYGVGDRKGLANNLVLAVVYRHLQETMKMLWEADVHLNTVHVTDLARAILFLCKKGASKEVYNIVDGANSTRGSIARIVSDIFDVNFEFIGNMTSQLSKLDLEGTVAFANEKHLPPWAEVCAAGGVHNTPLTPYIDQEFLKGAHLHLDGSKLRKMGFEYKETEPTKSLVVKILSELVELRMFPKDSVPKGVL